eukprot:6566667-Lingulodinium_polyedra.AAC.1
MVLLPAQQLWVLPWLMQQLQAAQAPAAAAGVEAALLVPEPAPELAALKMVWEHVELASASA